MLYTQWLTRLWQTKLPTSVDPRMPQWTKTICYLIHCHLMTPVVRTTQALSNRVRGSLFELRRRVVGIRDCASHIYKKKQFYFNAICSFWFAYPTQRTASVSRYGERIWGCWNVYCDAERFSRSASFVDVCTSPSIAAAFLYQTEC